MGLRLSAVLQAVFRSLATTVASGRGAWSQVGGGRFLNRLLGCLVTGIRHLLQSTKVKCQASVFMHSLRVYSRRNEWESHTPGNAVLTQMPSPEVTFPQVCYGNNLCMIRKQRHLGSSPWKLSGGRERLAGVPALGGHSEVYRRR